ALFPAATTSCSAKTSSPIRVGPICSQPFKLPTALLPPLTEWPGLPGGFIASGLGLEVGLRFGKLGQMARIIRKALIAFGILAALLIIVGLIVTLGDSNPASATMPN